MTHDEALRWAADARLAREALLEDLATGRVTLSGAFDRARDDEHVGAMSVRPVLEAVPGASKIATRRLLAELGIDERSPMAQQDAAAMVERFGSPT